MSNLTYLEEYLSKPHNRRIYEQERLMTEITDTIYQQMEQQGRNQNFLATRMGRSKGFISQVLSGKRNMTLRTVSDLYWTLNLRLIPKAESIFDTMCSTSIIPAPSTVVNFSDGCDVVNSATMYTPDLVQSLNAAANTEFALAA